MIIEWDKPFTLTTPLGSILINQPDGSGRIWRTVNVDCHARRSVRAQSATIDVPQGDGSLLFRRFSTGMSVDMKVEAWYEAGGVIQPGDANLPLMGDDAFGKLWSLNDPSSDGGRLAWTPSGADARIIDALRLRSVADPTFVVDTCATQVEFTMDSPFPYAISLFEDDVSLVGTVTIPNDGNVPFYPVIQVNGVSLAFTIVDNETGREYVYTSARPGAEAIGSLDYAEIDMFRGGLIYLNGNEDNLKAGVSVESSDILTVAPGGSSYSISGATATVLAHDAWA